MLSFSLPSKKCKKILLMLHGYGSSAANMMGVAEKIICNDIVCVAPDAPYRREGGGYKWFDIGDISNPDHNSLRNGVISVRSHIDAIIDNLVKEYHLTYEDVILFGFSQGAMIALDTVMRHEKLKYAIGVSGLFYRTSEQNGKGKTALLIHGTNDGVVDYHFALEAKKALVDLNAKVQLETCEGLGHSIDVQGVSAIKDFLKKIV
ncbi:MAG: dienelactone hydrolase family protein [Alphaproteobacteria bacterium]|nr:MAG: dienelactone hydrolase family protein [Alphaproteobacteria bacterium]